MASVEQIMKEALTLPSAARALLAEKLVESLEFDVDETLQALWTDEAKREHPSFLQRRRKSVKISKTSIFIYQ
ncbi:MAG: addiction module protein [Nostoc sp.]|uniref:addiction module protein n=1 Tax=Nostoc sp. TaxID=1180 RepID=UPI002FF6CDDA